MIACKDLIKHSNEDIIGTQLANKINNSLDQLKSKYRVAAVHANDNKLKIRVIGLTAYFIISENEKYRRTATMCFSSNALTFWDETSD